MTSSLALHVGAGGPVPPVAGFLVAWAVVAGVSYALSGRRWTFGRLLVLLGAGQLVLHPVFESTSRGSEVGYAESTMAVAHLAAAVLLAIVLAYGERVLWRLAEAAEQLMRPLLVLVDATGLVPAGDWRPVAVAVERATPASHAALPRAERAPPALSSS
ncbi:MAG: hypothetical protein GEV07_19485 [Streptosporangiales bacterium]|nr:hypothetical protein [Streptosporangiales bacterium]